MLHLEGEAYEITLSNLKDLNGLDFEIEDINEEFDISYAFEQIDALSDSYEIDLATDLLKFKLINPEDISLLELQTDDETKELTLDEFKLKPKDLSSVNKFLKSTKVGDLIYFKKSVGSIVVDYKSCNSHFTFNYIDCTNILDQYQILANSFYDELCDSIIINELKCSNRKVNIDYYNMKPKLIYAKLYKVIFDEISKKKVLEKLDIPTYYFEDKMEIDE